jgi:hypothetical protein
MAHTGPLSNTVAVHYDPLKKHEAIDGLGATNNKRVGARTLVEQQAQASPVIAPTTPTTPTTPTPAPEQSRVRAWVKWFLDRAVIPAVEFFGTEALVNLAPDDYQDLIRPLAHLFSATVAKPAMEWLSHQLVDALADPKTFLDSVKDTAEKAKADPWAVASQVLSLPKSKADAGKAARELILGSADAGATMLMLRLASEATGSKTLAKILEDFAPYFARTVRTLVDFTLDRAVPMHDVAPEDVPRPSDTLNLCTIWPATVTSVSDKLQGSYDATINFKPGSDATAALTGRAVVTTGPGKRVIGIKNLSGARLVLGGADKYALGELQTTAFGEHTGWSLSAGTMRGVAGKAKAKAKAKPTLKQLTVSPTGWIDGEFVRAGKIGRLGGKAADGAQWPVESATAATAAPTPRAVSSDGTLEAHVDGAIVRHYNKWLLGGGLAVVGWLTEHANLLPKHDPTPEEVAQASTKTWLQKLHLDPSDLIDHIASIDLVPDFLRTGYPKLGFHPYELKVGHEPSLAFSMSTSLQLFEQIGTASASGVVIAWLPFGASRVQVRADRLKFGEGLIVDGMELDPAGGIRTRHAMLKVPLPAAFSLPNVLLSADYLTVGPAIGFRNASATLQGFTVADVLTVESFAVTVKQPGKDPRFAAAAKGAVHLPGVKELTFAGEVHWGGAEPTDGRGTVHGAGIHEKGFSAKQVAGTLLVKKGVVSGTLTATDFAIEWNGYTLKTNASVTVDRQGIEKLSIEELAVWKADVQVGSASNVAYDRAQGQLTVGKLALDLPETGGIRATREKKRGGKPQLVTTDLDLSSLVQQPAKPKQAELPKPETLKPGIAVENLGKLELGPKPALLTLDFAKAKAAKPDRAEGAVAAYVSGNLRGFTLDEKLLEVEHSAKNAADVRVTLSGMRGAGYAIETATYDAGILEVTNADIQLDKLLGKSVPDALRGLTSNVKTSFTIDTHAGKLVALTAHGALTGKLFSGAVTITKATADLQAKPGSIADGLTDGFALTGTIAGTVTVKAYGVDATLSGHVVFPGGTPTLSGSGTKDNLAIDITDVTFVDGKPTFGTATVKIAAPMSEVVQFFPSPSTNVKEADQAKIVAWVAKKVEATADDGMPQATQSEQLVDPTAPAREIGVHLPKIHVGGDAFVLEADDVVVTEGKDQTVSLGASAKLGLGRLRGDVHGHVRMTIRGKDPMPDPKSLAFHVRSATLGGLAMTGVHYAEGRLTIAEATAKTPAVLGNVPRDFGLENIGWTAKNLAIDIASKTVSAEKLGATVTDLSTLGGALTIRSASAEVGLQGAPLDRTSLIPSNWAITLAATGAGIGTDVLSIGGSARLVIDRNGLRDGELTGASLRAGVGEASVGKIALTPDGWNASDVKLVVGRATKLGFDPIASLPAWLKTAADCQVQVTFPLSYSAKKLHWPALGDVKIDVLKAGIKLPGGISGSFDRTNGKRTASFAAKPPKAGFSVGLQVPLAQGIGIEFGGSLEHQVSLEANDVELKDSERLEFAGKVAGKAALKGRVRVGVFGGVPALFTVSAGIYAGLDLNAVLAADATGSWNLPKTAGKDSSGAVQLYLSMSDSATKEATSLTGEAGAYASVHVLGFGRTIEKSLAKAEIATIFAHGFAELSTDHGLRLLPTGQFPTHALHLHPTLEEKLTGGDAKQAIASAYQTIDRGVGKMEASEELLAGAPKTTADTAKPYTALTAELERTERTAATTAAASEEAVTTLEGALKRDRDWLEQARKKLEQYEVDLQALPAGKTLLARAALPGDVTARMRQYGKDLGRAAKKTQLDATALQTRIDCKKEEVAALAERIAENEEAHLAKRVEHTTDVNANHKATKKAKLSKLSQGDVKKDLAWRQRRLLEMYGTLQTAHKTATNRAAQSAGKTLKLEEDKQLAQRHVARLEADPTANATEKKFWTEQLTFVTAELKRVKAEAQPAPIVLPTRADLAVKRARAAQPDLDAKLSDQVIAELAKYEAKIEATTRALADNMVELAELGDGLETEAARAPLERKRRELLVELHKAQDKLAGALAREEAMSA